MDCELCKSINEKFRLIYVTKYSFCIIPREPLKLGHIMAIPKRHVENLSDLTKDETKDLLDLVDKMKHLIEKKIFIHSPIIFMNAGKHNTQKHIHLHILPSKGGLRSLISNFEGVPGKEPQPQKVMENMKDYILKFMN